MAPVGRRHFLEIQMEWLADGGINHFLLSLGHAAEAVVAQLPKLASRFSIDYVIEPRAFGTGGAALYSLSLGGLEEALVVNGDTIFDGSIDAMLEPLRCGEQELARIASVAVDDRNRFGGVLTFGGRVTEFLEKGASGPGVINGGMYRLSRKTFRNRAVGSSFSIETDVFPNLVNRNSITAVKVGTNFIDIGVPEDYKRFLSRYDSNG
jgi:D-glycero-alpha-D-manno-heptose 1-phosphate guanylyltransferase